MRANKTLTLRIDISDVRPVPAGKLREGAVNARFKYSTYLETKVGKVYATYFPGCVAYINKGKPGKPGGLSFMHARLGGTTTQVNADMKELILKAIKDNPDILRIVKPKPEHAPAEKVA
jgi:type I restriction-modification system DNA methylase subunit